MSPPEEEMLSTMKYTDHFRRGLFLASMHQITGGKSYIGDEEFNKPIKTRLTDYELMGSFLYPPTM